MNIAELLRDLAQSHPQSAALIDVVQGQPRVTTYAELDAKVARAATLLQQGGLRAGDAVLVFYPMSAELYVALLALFRLGLVAMFLDPASGRAHMERCCALHAPRGLIASPRAHLLRLWSRALRQIPHKFVIGLPVPGAVRWTRLEDLPPHPDIVPCAAEAPALLTFTSGSTGQPRAALRSHGFLLAQHRSLGHSLNLTPGEVDLATLPIVLLANLASGVTSVVPNADLRYPGQVDPAPIVAQMVTHGVTSSVASPAFFERLARYCHSQRITLPRVTRLFTGGAPVFPRLLEQMQAMAPNAEIVALYGSTEAEPIAHIARRELTPEDHQAMLSGAGLLAGPPVEEIQLRILRARWGEPIGPFTPEEFATRCCAPDEAGEIVVHGDHVLTGYLHGQGDEETKFRVGTQIWHRTGDAGRLDPAGRLWLLGRCGARIEDSRGVLYPFTAETAVYQDPRIKRAALVAHRGRRILALECYEANGLLDVAAVQRTLAWTHLDEVRLCRHIPVDKRHNAKIDYPALHQLLERGS